MRRLQTFSGLVLAIGGMMTSAPALAQDAPVATLAAGQIRGAVKDGVSVFHGIPYAAPPVADLRWMPPQPAPDWTDVRDGTVPVAQCPQNAELGVFSKVGGAEDCLYLNVFVPQGAGPDLPVLVWLHGGGYFVGSANDYDGASLARDAQAVVVTVGYRLGILGFMAHPDIDAEGHAFGNYGLMDQQAALRWIRDNIASLGGDPQNVTIFGESSGGTSVISHVVSPGSSGLFQHAIAMSGTAIVIKPGNFGAAPGIETAREMGQGFAQAAGCGENVPDCLRQLPVEAILGIQPQFMTNQAFIDGTVIPAPYGELLQSGEFNRVTMMMGSTLDEWTWAAGFAENASGRPMTADAYPTALADYYGPELAGKVAEAYPLTDYLSASEAYSAAATASLMSCTGRQAATWMSEHVPVYFYEFADRTAPSYLEPTTFPLGAAHTFEIPYLFKGFRGGEGRPVTLNPLQEALSAQMIRDFATAEARGSEGDDWPAYDPAKDDVRTYALPEARMSENRFARMHRCDFWDTTGIY